MFHHVARLLSHFCQCSISQGRTWLRVEEHKSKSARPRLASRCSTLYDREQIWLDFLIDQMTYSDFRMCQRGQSFQPSPTSLTPALATENTGKTVLKQTCAPVDLSIFRAPCKWVPYKLFVLYTENVKF